MFKKVFISVLVLFFISCTATCFSQKTIEVVFTRFGKLKKFEIYNGNVLDYKLKGEHRYHKNKITNLQDSFIVFSNDTIISLNRLKTIRFHKNNVLITLLQGSLTIFGGGFFLLNTTNNIINDRSPILSEKAAVIAGSLIVAGVLVRQLNTRRLHINKHKQIRIVDLDFQHLSEKPAE